MVEVNNCEYAELIEARNELDILLNMYARKNSTYELEPLLVTFCEKYDIKNMEGIENAE